ncbi:MAG: SBBP repeat-containing protein [Bryobacteraceae bacterium]
MVNYLIADRASGWIKNIPTYSRVRYSQLYPGVDVVYYVNDGRLEYDLVLARGADPGRIRLRVEGAQGLRVDEAGDLVIATAGGELRQHRPIVYQESNGGRRQVAVRYQLRGREVRFALGRYDRSQPLVIDPTLAWSSYVLPTNTANAQAAGVALDSAGNIYLTGTALTTSGYNAMYVAKLNSTGTTAAYVTFLGGLEGDTFGEAIALNTAGDIFLAGATDSPEFLYDSLADVYYLSSYTFPGSSIDAVMFEVDNAAQNPIWGHYFGGSQTDIFYGMALDSSGNVYLVGSTNSPDLYATAGSAQTGLRGPSNAFIAAFTSEGALGYCTYLGGSGTDSGNAIAVDAVGDAFVTGSTTSTNFPVAGTPYQSTLKGGADAFVAKIGPPGGALIYSTYLGGSANDEGTAIAVDPSGAVYVTGDTASTDFPVLPNPGAYQSTYGGGATDAFVARLAGSGSSLLYSTYLGGSGADAGYSIAIDSTGNAYITGNTSSTNYPITGDAFQSSNQGVSNAMVTGLNASGSGLLFSSYLGGNGSMPLQPAGSTNYGDYGTSIALNCATGLVVAGVTSSTNFPADNGTVTGMGALTAGHPGIGPDGFVAQIAAGAGVPDITPGGIVNNATFATGAVAPGSIVSIFGSGLAPFSQTFSGFPLATTLAGASVSVNSMNAPMFYAGWGQINIQVPFEIGAGTAEATVSNGCGSSGRATFTVQQAAPYILQTVTGQGAPQAIVQNYIASTQQYTLNGPNNPAQVGSVVVVYLIGIGPVTNQPLDGAAAATPPPLSSSTLPYSATIGGWTSTVNFLGLAPTWVGLDQANLVVPGLSTGAYPVVITVGGVASNGPMMYVTQ